MNPKEVTEEKLGEILRLYSAFGRVAKRSQDQNKEAEPEVGQPFVLFAPNKEKLLMADGGKVDKAQGSSSTATGLTAEDASYMIVKAVEPLTGISCLRSFFFRAPWKKVDVDESEATGVRILAAVYSMMVETTLKAVEILVESTSPMMARKFVEEKMAEYFHDAHNTQNVDHGGWEFRLEGLRPDGSGFPLKAATDVIRGFKRATLLVYDLTVEGGKNLGCLAFADSFVDSHVQMKDCKEEVTPSNACFYLTEGW